MEQCESIGLKDAKLTLFLDLRVFFKTYYRLSYADYSLRLYTVSNTQEIPCRAVTSFAKVSGKQFFFKDTTSRC